VGARNSAELRSVGLLDLEEDGGDSGSMLRRRS
jgi:hypothetical protein